VKDALVLPLDTSVKSLKVKERWISETHIEPARPVDWLNGETSGNATSFISSYAVHKFEIKFPFSGLTGESHAFLSRIALDFSTSGDAGLLAVGLYEGLYLLWAKDGPALRNDRSFIQPSNHLWKVRPEVPAMDDLTLELTVFFGAPNSTVPEFRFHAAQAELSFTEVS
jgi:hypothetical protein